MSNKNNSTKNKYLLKNTFLLSIGNFGSKLISFFLVPLYTNILTTSEYGTLDLMTIISTVVVPIITLNISEAIMRFSMDKDTDKNKILSVGVHILLLSSVLSILSYPIFKNINITSNFAFLLRLLMISLGSSQIFLYYLRGNEQLLNYSIISIIQSLLILIEPFLRRQN